MKYLLLILLFLFHEGIYAQQTVGLFTNTPQAFDGYTLFAPINSKETYLIDNCGRKVHSWTSQYTPGLSCYLLENGILLRAGKLPGMGNGGGIVEMIDWNSNVIWSYSSTAGYGKQHHDVELLPNGNILLIVWDERSQAEVIQAGASTNQTVVNSEQIIEVQPDIVNGGATVVWQWKAWEHLVQDKDGAKPNYAVVAQHPEKIDINFLPHTKSDWLHINGIDYNAKFDQVIVSVHNFSEFWIIDHSTTTAEAQSSSGGSYGKGGDLLYRWGNPQAYDQGTANDQQLFLQHHAHWIPEGYKDEGKIMVFNNQAGTPQSLDYSTVSIVELPVDVNGNYTYSGGAYGPSGFDWTYKAPNPTDFFSNIISGAERLENGNTLICQGVGGRFFEIDEQGNIVWEYVNPVNDQGPMTQNTQPQKNDVFRCTRYAPGYSAFTGKTLAPQGYIETGSTFSCNLYPASVNDMNTGGSGISFYPNPAKDFITLKVGNNKRYMVKVYSIDGRCLLQKEMDNSKIQLDIHSFSPGMYFFHVTDGETSHIEKIQVY